MKYDNGVKLRSFHNQYFNNPLTLIQLILQIPAGERIFMSILILWVNFSKNDSFYAHKVLKLNSKAVAIYFS